MAQLLHRYMSSIYLPFNFDLLWRRKSDGYRPFTTAIKRLASVCPPWAIVPEHSTCYVLGYCEQPVFTSFNCSTFCSFPPWSCPGHTGSRPQVSR
jgi:hypothetical protein